MDKSADQPINSTTNTNNGVDFRSPDQKVPRRRFVQSTLFPLKPHGDKTDNSSTKEAKDVEEIKVVDVDDDDDVVECCGSQGSKKKRGRKPKQNSTPQKRRSKKVADSGKDDCIVLMDDTEFRDEASPQQQKEKRQTPTRKGKASGNKRTSNAKTPPRQVAPQTVPDLWQEAKKTAEENSRIFAGKQIHPFFSSWKAGKKDQEIIEVESYGCLDKWKERDADFNPIHVFEDDKDNVNFNDWSNWTFIDEPFSRIPCNQGTKISYFEGSVMFDTGIASNPFGTSLPCKDVSCGQYYGADERDVEITRSGSPVLADVVAPIDLLQNAEKELEESKLFISDDDDKLDSDLELQNVLQDRMMSHYLNRANQPKNSLWTYKYQPEKASEVCGNNEAVKFINDWLRLWHAADFRVRKKSRNDDNFVKDDEYDSDDHDSYAENADEPSDLKNVLLVSGPVGSGKSAAIYACAKEQGFEVIEVNASDWRNGAILKQKFGEAVGLHWLKRSKENHVGSQRKLDFNSSPGALRHGAEVFDLNEDAVEVISMPEEESVGGAGIRTDGGVRTDPSEIKTLLLFEDVDATLCEDRGFISTIQQLADTGRKPMILTSNSENPELPNNLDREEISFTLPSSKELIRHIYLVCAAEKAYLQPHLIERCIDFCGGDIRKSLLYLQFWCQRNGCIKDVKMQSTNRPMMFSLSAMHCTLPKLISWGLPSSLSEFIEAEIAKSQCRVEDHFLSEILEEDESNVLNKLDFYKVEVDIIEAKKQAILRENSFSHVDDDNIAASSLREFFHCSDSPIAFSRRNIRRKLDIVFSDSEDELLSHDKPPVSNALSSHINHNLLPRFGSHVPVPSPVKGVSNEFGDHLLNNGATIPTKMEELSHHFSEAADASHINSLAVCNTSNQSTDLFLHSANANFPGINNHCQQLLDLNSSYCEEPRNPMNLFNEVLSHTLEAQMKMSGKQFSSMSHVLEGIPAMGSGKNQSSNQPNHFGEVMAAETECRFAANHCLNPLSDPLQQCVPTNTTVDRCLFPPTVSADPIICTLGNLGNSSGEGQVHCREASLTELLDWGTVTNRNQVAADESLNQLFEQSIGRVKTTTENIERQQPSFTSPNPFSCHALNFSSNSLGDHSSHPSEANGKGVWNQHSEAGEQTLKFCTTLVGHMSQSKGQHLRPTLEETQQPQQQDTGSYNLNHTLCLLPDVSLKQIEDAGMNSVFHQSLETSNIGFTSCPADGNSNSPPGGKVLRFIEAKSEEQQHQYSDATDFIHTIDRCWSADVSRVPESTFVPETVVNDGAETAVGMDVMEIVSPMTTVDIETSTLRLDVPKIAQVDIDINVNTRNEDTGDSQSDGEHRDASTSGCHVMDECSRMDFCKKPKRLRSSRSELKFPVQEKWNELRLADLRHYYISEHENARQMLDLAFGVSNLISDGDLLLHDCEFLINDSFNQDTGLTEENFTFGWHDQQIQMASTIAELGSCLYAKDINALQLKTGTDYAQNLDWELLTSTNNSITLGKLLRLNRNKSQGSLGDGSSIIDVQSASSSIARVRETCLTNIVRSVTPSKTFLALKGSALHDYLSSLAHISRIEASRLAEREAAQKTQRRRIRATKNYLTSGALDLSPEDISLLNKYNSYGRIPS
ncbi:hypothetical protein RND81_03G236100 [Saponaria officinalis]|uniref:AAA+ ATPase domain-containing protein n=1 Tax=Saponaria officinalis TaxID=3572 RepID=A0AAW1M9T6_SAPOF